MQNNKEVCTCIKQLRQSVIPEEGYASAFAIIMLRPAAVAYLDALSNSFRCQDV